MTGAIGPLTRNAKPVACWALFLRQPRGAASPRLEALVAHPAARHDLRALTRRPMRPLTEGQADAKGADRAARAHEGGLPAELAHLPRQQAGEHQQLAGRHL